jgi:Lon protease-like protein
MYSPLIKMKGYLSLLVALALAIAGLLPTAVQSFQSQPNLQSQRHPPLSSSSSSLSWRTTTTTAHQSLLRRRSSSNSDDNTSEDEQEGVMDEAERMELVRKLQKTFYQPSGSEDDDNTSSAAATKLDPTTGIFHNLPLWRVGWVELPGRANCLNVHEGHYTNMFETILAGPQPWYVGHLHLPGGTKNSRKLNETAFQLKNWQDEIADDSRWDSSSLLLRDRSAVVGCLMRITDYRRLQDGRLILLVHPLERFVVQKTLQSFPFGRADVQMLPDMDAYLANTFDTTENSGDENFYKVARAKAVRASFAHHEYECSTTRLLPLPKQEDYLATDTSFGSAITAVLPFSFFADDDSSLLEDTTAAESASSSSKIATDDAFLGAAPPLEHTLINAGILQFPFSLTGGTTDNGDSDNNADNDDDDDDSSTVLETLLWLELDDFCRAQSFRLPKEVLQLMPPNLVETLDLHPPAQFLSSKYPIHRRQQRLSYHIPALIEQTRYGANMRQVWLNTPTTAARLRAVLQRFQAINEANMGQFE